MKRNLLLVAVLLLGLVAACESTGGAAAAATAEKGEPKVDLNLAAADAELITTGALVLENGDTNIGYWSKLDDQAKWTVDVPEAGEYSVLVRYSCTETQPGSNVKITVADQSVEFTVKSTTDWTTWIKPEVGKVNLKAGKQTVVMQATKIAQKYVCNVSNIWLQKY